MSPIVYHGAWAVWIVWFIAFETAALFGGKTSDTLSGHVWNVLRVRDGRSTWFTLAARALTAAGGIWLAGHLAMGWWS